MPSSKQESKASDSKSAKDGSKKESDLPKAVKLIRHLAPLAGASSDACRRYGHANTPLFRLQSSTAQSPHWTRQALQKTDEWS